MNRINLLVIASALLLWCVPRALAQGEEPAHPASPATVGESTEGESAASPPGAAHEGPTHEGGAHEAGPAAPDTRHRWPVPTLFVILGMFLAAAVIGPIVRAQAPAEMPPTHSHDEPPGASHHHGDSGTINPIPEDVAKLEQGDSHDHGHHH